MESRKNNTDIIIIGGGLIGGTLAQSLASAGFTVTVVDDNDPKHMLKKHIDGRSYAISTGSKAVLKKAGLWSELQERAHPVKVIKVGTEVDNTFLTFHAHEVDEDAMGYLVDATILKRTILKKSMDHSEIQWLAPDLVKDFTCGARDVAVTLESGTKLNASLLIAADGKGSKMRQDAHIPTSEWDYNQLAFVFNVEHAHSHHDTAYELFMPEGPFAMLPYPKNRSGCVWSMKQPYARHMQELSEIEFEEEINARFGGLCGHLKLVTKPKAFPLSACQPHRYVDNRFVLIGDAAHAIHPVAGQGLNLGFRDVDGLTKELSNARELGLDFGGATTLQTYQKMRRFDNLSLLAVTDTSVRLFSTRNIPFRWVLSKGFTVLDKLPPLKKAMIRQAMGLIEEMPAF